ncbi:MAG: hypothetical protein QF438_01625, partial [Phycisphaerales bacterium]|nr:hypothetical protein [Phycisphaerales bacterium]
LAACGVTTSAVGFDTTTEIGIAAEVVGTDLVPDIGANRTFRIWAVTPEGWRIDAVAGNSEVSMRFEVVGGTFYQNEWGGPTSISINAGFFSLAPDLEWDSFFTIGLLTNTDNSLLDLGIDWTDFEAGNLLETSNGSVFVLPTDVQGELVAFTDACGTTGNGVLIAQLTLVGEEASLEGSVLLQGHDDQGQVFQAQIDNFSIDADGVSDALPQITCAADITGDDQVDVMDLLHLLEHWYDGSCEDITQDLVVNGADVLLLVESWGSCSEE